MNDLSHLAKGKKHLATNIMTRYPRHAFNRYLLRAMLALPFIVVALVSTLAGYTGFSENTDLIRRVNSINFGDISLAWIADLFPLLPTVIASIVPSELVLSLLGAGIAGWLLQNILEAMRQKNVPMWLTVSILITFSVSPLMFFNATENLGAIMGMAAFAVAFINMIRFIENGSTFNGFRAGFFFLVASISDVNGLMYLLMALAALPMLTAMRKGVKGAVSATMNVLLFPSIAALVSILIVNWIVARQSVWDSLGNIVNIERFGQLTRLPYDGTEAAGFLFVIPVAVMWLAAQAFRKDIRIFFTAALIVLLEFITMIFSSAGGDFTGILFLVLVALTLALLTNKRTTILNIMAFLATIIQWVCSWSIAYYGQTTIWPFVEFFINVFTG